MQLCNPRELVSDRRLDLAIKYRLFKELLYQSCPDAKRLYRWHIMKRTGGVERGSWKRSIDDYFIACGELLDEMCQRGFDPASPVLIDDRRRIYDGAHRIACAILLDLDIAVARSPKPALSPAWDSEWMLTHGLFDFELERIEKTLSEMKGTG